MLVVAKKERFRDFLELYNYMVTERLRTIKCNVYANPIVEENVILDIDTVHKLLTCTY